MCSCSLNLAVNYVLFSVSCLTAKIIFAVRGDRGHNGDVLKHCRGTGEQAGQTPLALLLLPVSHSAWPELVGLVQESTTNETQSHQSH